LLITMSLTLIKTLIALWPLSDQVNSYYVKLDGNQRDLLRSEPHHKVDIYLNRGKNGESVIVEQDLKSNTVNITTRRLNVSVTSFVTRCDQLWFSSASRG